MGVIFLFEILGTIAFAVSGSIVAIEKEMDIFGVSALGMTTAVGGGIIRDIILGITPPIAFQKPIYALLAIVISLIVFIPKFRTLVKDLNHPFYIVIDSVGLAVFTVVGVRSGIDYSNGFLAIFVGLLTGVGGGVLRDLFAEKQPYIFTKHFYASASLIGAIITVLCWKYDRITAMLAGALIIVILRVLAAKYKWSLPKA